MTISIRREPTAMTRTSNRGNQHSIRNKVAWNVKVVTVGANLLLLVYISLLATMNRPWMYEKDMEFLNPASGAVPFRTVDSGCGRAILQEKVGVDDFSSGVLSRKPKSFFKQFQDQVDNENLNLRCQRYGFQMQHPMGRLTAATPRRIFYGSLIAEEPWELFEIVAAETYGIFAGMVFVEGNRTQSFHPREFKRANQKFSAQLQGLFGTPQLQIRRFVNEENGILPLQREHMQREDILKGWKKMGMTPNDVGYIADADETFSRDFLRAVQYCPYVAPLDYRSHHCLNIKTKIIGVAQVFESSPLCVTEERVWHHPDMIIGSCIESIGDSRKNPIAPRNGFKRRDGWGAPFNLQDVNESNRNVPTKGQYPLYNAGDFRHLASGRSIGAKPANRSIFSAFHFHNFFANFESVRNKYLTYGHASKTAMEDPIENMSNDLAMMTRCLLNQTDGYDTDDSPDKQKRRRILGRFETIPQPWPIYFRDSSYRHQKHKYLRDQYLKDEERRQTYLNWTQDERELERLAQDIREAKRIIFDRTMKIDKLKEPKPERRRIRLG